MITKDLWSTNLTKVVKWASHLVNYLTYTLTLQITSHSFKAKNFADGITGSFEKMKTMYILIDAGVP